MSLWKSPLTPEQMNSFHRDTLVKLMGIEFTEIGADFVRGTMPVDGRTHQPYGLLHGGASVVLAETLGSTGAAMCVDAAEFQCVGQEVNANHVRAVRSGQVTGTARPVHIGGRTQVWAIDIVDAAAKLVCTSRLTVAVIRRGTLGGL
jgi:uncharacterized protein (TIGR00369 family)